MKKGPGLKKGVAGGAPPKATPGFNTIRGALKRNSTVAPGGGEGVPQWLRVQIAIYSRFVEQRLAHAGIKDVKITNVLEDVSSGKVLAQLLEVLSGQKYAGKLSEKELGRIQAMSQVSDVLKWMEGTLKVDLKRCSPEDVVDKKDKAVFGMLYSVILKFVKLDEGTLLFFYSVLINLTFCIYRGRCRRRRRARSHEDLVHAPNAWLQSGH